MLTPLARAAERLGLRDGTGVVAVSGGGDSTALLLGCVRLGWDVSVAHFHHHLRGADADADAEFVRQLALAHGLRHDRGDGTPAARPGNVESAARRMRYAWLAEVAVVTGAAWVATAHTADDQAETVLHNLLRGTGLRGLAGIAESRALAPGVRLVRPLLTVRGRDLRAWLNDQGQPYREDATNRDPAQTRARIRHELLPVLESYNPRAAEAIARAAPQAAAAVARQAGPLAAMLTCLELPATSGQVALDLNVWRRLAPADRVAVARHLWGREAWPARDLSTDVLEVIAAALDPPVTRDLPGRVRLEVRRGVVRLARTS